jgi:hypothetical protein
MSSSSSDNTKLIVAATAAAVSGAVIGISILKLWESQQQRQKHTQLLLSSNKTSLDGKIQRPSIIFEDPNSDIGMILDSNSSSNLETLLFPHNHEEKMRRRIAARVAVEEDNHLPRDSVTVRVPATSANMGPGCKCY